MLRISLISQDVETVKLRLEGRLISCCVSELKKECLSYINNKNKRVILDFARVSFVEPNGVDMLRNINSDKLCIVNCLIFIEKLLEDLL